MTKRGVEGCKNFNNCKQIQYKFAKIKNKKILKECPYKPRNIHKRVKYILKITKINILKKLN